MTSLSTPVPGTRPVGIQCKNLCVGYGTTAVLNDICLDIQPGEFFALLGPSGSGKSTLLRVLAGFVPHQHGEMLMGGCDVSGLAPWQRQTGTVFQNYALWPHLSVWDNVAFGLRERRLAPAQVQIKVAAMLELMGLSSRAQHRTTALSGGQQQRVALARTLVTEPQVLLLDEPLSNLDKSLRVQMRRELRSLQRRLGLTTVFVTHDQEEAMTTADRMAVLDQGVLQQVGPPMTLYDYPVNRFVAGFVGTMNVLTGRVRQRQGGWLMLDVDVWGELRLPSPKDIGAAVTQVSVTFRPNAVRLDVSDAHHDARYIWLPGVVESSEFMGAYTRYGVRVGSHLLAADWPHRMGLSNFQVGVAVALGLEPSRIRLFA